MGYVKVIFLITPCVAYNMPPMLTVGMLLHYLVEIQIGLP